MILCVVFDDYSTWEVHSFAAFASKHLSHRRTIPFSVAYSIRLALYVPPFIAWQITSSVHCCLWYLHLCILCPQWKTWRTEESFFVSFNIISDRFYSFHISCSPHYLLDRKLSKEIPFSLWSHHHASLLLPICFACCLLKPKAVDFVEAVTIWNKKEAVLIL